MALDVSMDQVRKHLEELGYADVPTHVLEEFTAELAARVKSSAVSDELSGGESSARRSTLRVRTASESNVVRRNESRELKRRGTRLGGKPVENQRAVEEAVDQEGEDQVENSAQQHHEPASRAKMEPSQGSLRSVTSMRSTTSSFIRPQSAGTIKRKDPVAAYQKVAREWCACPSVVGGSKKQPIHHVPSTAKPRDKPIWKSVHPLENSEGTDLSYVVPTTKPRVREMTQVRDSLKWQEVYKPAKTDRVYANEAVRAYTIPDDKRRDDLRWNTRVMMHSYS